jgi:AraC-like DNA-binding protein
MGRRTFDPCQVEYGDRRVRGVRTRCGACGFEGKVPLNTHGHPSTRGEAESIEAAKKFQAIGWEINSTPSKDRCPACVRAAKSNKGKPAERPTNGANMGAQQAKPIETVAHAPAPPEMSLADRRIIFAKLEDVYGTENTGYTGAWTDKTVAEDLGVPRAWVTSIREQFFGAAGGNAVLHEQIEEARRVIAEGRKLLAEVSDLKSRIDEQQATINRLMRDTAPLLTLVSSVEARIISLAKTVG